MQSYHTYASLLRWLGYGYFCSYFSYFHEGVASPQTSNGLAPCTPYSLPVITDILNLLHQLYWFFHVLIGLSGWLEERSRQRGVSRYAHDKSCARTSNVSSVNPIQKQLPVPTMSSRADPKATFSHRILS